MTKKVLLAGTAAFVLCLTLPVMSASADGYSEISGFRIFAAFTPNPYESPPGYATELDRESVAPRHAGSEIGSVGDLAAKAASIAAVGDADSGIGAPRRHRGGYVITGAMPWLIAGGAGAPLDARVGDVSLRDPIDTKASLGDNSVSEYWSNGYKGRVEGKAITSGLMGGEMVGPRIEGAGDGGGSAGFENGLNGTWRGLSGSAMADDATRDTHSADGSPATAPRFGDGIYNTHDDAGGVGLAHGEVSASSSYGRGGNFGDSTGGGEGGTGDKVGTSGLGNNQTFVGLHGGNGGLPAAFSDAGDPVPSPSENVANGPANVPLPDPPTSVPEPASLLLFGAALIAFAALWRWRERQ